MRAVLSSLSVMFHPSRGMSTETSSQRTASMIVGVAQLRATNDKVHNLLEIAKCAGWAKQQQASMLFLPENCGKNRFIVILFSLA